MNSGLTGYSMSEDDFDFFDPDTVREIRISLAGNGFKSQLPDDVLNIIYSRRLFKLFVPDRFKGRMTPLPEALHIIEECAHIDGSFGWSVCIGAGGGYFAGYMDKELAKRLITPENWVISGSGAPSGMVKSTGNGYEISGRWKYSSGANYASMFTVNSIMHSDKDTIKSFILLPDEVEIINDWNACGMKATDSQSIKTERLMLNKNRVFDLDQVIDDYGQPIYLFPFKLFAQCSFAAVVLGVWRNFIQIADSVCEEAQNRWNQENPKRYPYIKKMIGEQQDLLDDSTGIFYETFDKTWRKFCREEKLSEDLQKKGGTLCCRLAEIAFDSSSKIFYNLGMRAVMDDEPVNRIWRDLTTAVQHILLKEY